MLHIKLPDFRISEVFLIAFEILLSHLICIYEVYPCVLHMDIVLKPGQKICVVFISDRFGLEFLKTSHELICRLITHLKKVLEFFFCFRFLLFTAGKTC